MNAELETRQFVFPKDSTVLYVTNPTEREMQVYLKMKIKSLTEEARIIRVEERKYLGHGRKAAGRNVAVEHVAAHYGTYNALRSHRVREVRSEQRCSLLAYAYIRGKKYAQIENKPARAPDWKRVSQIVKKFAGEKAASEFYEVWRKDE